MQRYAGHQNTAMQGKPAGIVTVLEPLAAPMAAAWFGGQMGGCGHVCDGCNRLISNQQKGAV